MAKKETLAQKWYYSWVTALNELESTNVTYRAVVKASQEKDDRIKELERRLTEEKQDNHELTVSLIKLTNDLNNLKKILFALGS